ncbi:MAG: ATP:cob(I)alamin adenosyltransferase, partial [Gemmatimonadetes bacterium]|nr:ATP:cob(I)alamin adenosyltransferase [Gemmatimonadota bacterium]
VVELSFSEDVDRTILSYLNRLSDYLFAAARLENERDGTGDLEWQGSEP